MGDSDAVVTQASTAVGFASLGYPSTDNVGAKSNTGANVDIPAVENTGGDRSGTTDVAQAVSQKDTAHTDSVMLEASTPNKDETEPSVGVAYNHLIISGVENIAVESNQTGSYDLNSNGNIVNGVKNFSAAGSVENGNSSADVQGTTTEQQLADGIVVSAEEERLWSIVRANSLDFSAWTSLIEETEKTSEDNILKIRKVYDAFLAEFPLCYGYWKKYADHELRMGSIDKVVEVYERAVQGVTYSVDIWLHYCVFAISTYGDQDTIRRLFERGLAYVGTDYLSFLLWDKYIEYEYTQQEWGRLAMIYTRILENPNQQLDRYYNSFKELSASRPLGELRSPEESAAAAGANSVDGQGIEGSCPEAEEGSSKTASAGLTEMEELEKYISVRDEMYKKAKEFDSKIIGFETAIRRPYFHVKPLSDSELENWHSYLDYVEREGDFNKLSNIAAPYASLAKPLEEATFKTGYFPETKAWTYNKAKYFKPSIVVKLYERCLIACANYPEYWVRYILCMEASGSMELADNALARATQVFVKRQPEIHLFAARFKEEHGDIQGARAAYQHLHDEISPGLLEAIINHANMERRLGNMEGAFSLYEQAIAIEKGKEHSQTLPMLFAQYSRFVYLVYGNPEKAREILVEALEHVQLSKPLLEALLYLESVQSLPKQIEYLDSLVDKFIMTDPDSSNMASVVEKEELSRIFLEFLGLFGDAQSIKKATDRHARFFLHHRGSSHSRKRAADDFLVSEKAKAAKSYSGIPSTAPSVMGAYPGAQGQWTVNYGSQPQTWPQVTPAQAQPWNPGYTQQQAAYPGYYGSSYTQPQMPTSVPQAAAYGTYPPTYPAYHQQTYTAPVTAATVPVQQPALTPQSYYGGGYFT